jgi:exodeoxyribonuclease V alpha subunit
MADRQPRHSEGVPPPQAAQATASDTARAALAALFRAAGAPLALVPRVLRTYGDAACRTARDEPYRLVRDVPGFPFAAADQLAALREPLADQPQRLSAALWALLNEAAAHEGHVFLPRAELIGRAMALLGLPRAVVSDAVTSLAAAGELWIEGAGPDRPAGERSDDAVYLLPLYRAEAALARRISALITSATSRLAPFQDAPWDRAFDWLAQRHGLALHDDERAAVRALLTQPLSAVTAPRGGAWPTVVRAVLALAAAKQVATRVVAPTALAAEHATRALGVPVRPLGLGVSPPAEHDLLIVVHADQLDLWQAYALAEALPDGAHLALVGDPRVLPPLGPGWPFVDLATCAAEGPLAPRPGAARASLIGFAERIARGEPAERLLASDDVMLYPADDAEHARAAVVELACERLPRQWRIPPERIAVLCLARHGAAGAAAVSAALSARLGQGPAAARAWGRVFRQGERVILAEALPHLGLARGTLARVAGPGGPAGGLRLLLPDRQTVAIDEADLPVLAPAAALAVAQAQGGPFRAVIVPIVADDYAALTRRALYSAVTSAQERCILVGQERALNLALSSDRPPLRYRRLDARLGAARS